MHPMASCSYRISRKSFNYCLVFIFVDEFGFRDGRTDKHAFHYSVRRRSSKEEMKMLGHIYVVQLQDQLHSFILNKDYSVGAGQYGTDWFSLQQRESSGSQLLCLLAFPRYRIDSENRSL